jgi:hypothetical protein
VARLPLVQELPVTPVVVTVKPLVADVVDLQIV